MEKGYVRSGDAVTRQGKSVLCISLFIRSLIACLAILASVEMLMANDLNPGVYTEEMPESPRQIIPAATSRAAFVGTALLGPPGKAVLVSSFGEYCSIYGAICSPEDAMGLAVMHYFLNGGRSAYICRLAGADSVEPDADAYRAFYETVLSSIPDVSMIILPGIHWSQHGSGNAVIEATIAHCELMGDRMVIIDLSPTVRLDRGIALQELNLSSSPYAALYYPWITVANPVDGAAGQAVSVAPSAFAAGIWSRIARERGVWKAPAGLDASLIGAAGLQYEINRDEQGRYNLMGINCIRELPEAGCVIWGARSLAPDHPVGRFIPVMRTAIMIRKSIIEGTQWAVFEPNNSGLWSALRNSAESFMTGLFREGAFQGSKPSEAFFVQCGLYVTMTQEDIDAGEVVIIVGFAPARPAEFVTLQIRHTVPTEAGSGND